MLDQGGTDVTELFDAAGHDEEAKSVLGKLKVGVLEGKVSDFSKSLQVVWLNIV